MKKAFGIILIFFGVIFVPITVAALFQFGLRMMKLIFNFNIYQLEELLGGLIFVGLVGFINFVFFKYGYRLIKGKKSNEASDKPL